MRRDLLRLVLLSFDLSQLLTCNHCLFDAAQKVYAEGNELAIESQLKRGRNFANQYM